jgi:hypothetical protein
MLSRVAADAVLLLHGPAALWAAGIELAGAVCPLTYLENDLRERSGQQGYAGGFVEHYLLPVLYPAGLTPAVQYLLAGVVLGVNLMLYGWLWHRRRARRGGTSRPSVSPP